MLAACLISSIKYRIPTKLRISDREVELDTPSYWILSMKDLTWVRDSEDYQAMLGRWQEVVDVMAEACHAPEGFVVQYTENGYMAVVASSNDENPYCAGEVVNPDVNLFCKKVIETHQPLYVPDASKDDYWDDNPEYRDGFISYLLSLIHISEPTRPY